MRFWTRSAVITGRGKLVCYVHWGNACDPIVVPIGYGNECWMGDIAIHSDRMPISIRNIKRLRTWR